MNDLSAHDERGQNLIRLARAIESNMENLERMRTVGISGEEENIYLRVIETQELLLLRSLK